MSCLLLCLANPRISRSTNLQFSQDYSARDFYPFRMFARLVLRRRFTRKTSHTALFNITTVIILVDWENGSNEGVDIGRKCWRTFKCFLIMKNLKFKNLLILRDFLDIWNFLWVPAGFFKFPNYFQKCPPLAEKYSRLYTIFPFLSAENFSYRESNFIHNNKMPWKRLNKKENNLREISLSIFIFYSVEGKYQCD